MQLIAGNEKLMVFIYGGKKNGIQESIVIDKYYTSKT